MIKAVIFDMDGLMIDSERVTFEGYQKVLKEMGLSITEEFYKSVVGRTVYTATQAYEEEYGKDFSLADAYIKVCDYINEQFDTKGVPIKKGLIELLTYLRENGYYTVVATSSTRERVDHILELTHLKQYFDASICGDEVTKGKPHPEVFLNACKKIHVDPSEALVLEDSEAGIQAAFNAHIPVICIPDMKYPDNQYVEMTTQILQSLDQVIDYLK